MKIVIPTNDLENLEKRTGHAKYFAVFEASKEKIELIEKVKNNHDHNHEHNEGEHNHGHEEQTKMIAQYDAFVVNILGQHFKADVETAGINVFYTKKSNIKEAIKDYLENGKH